MEKSAGSFSRSRCRIVIAGDWREAGDSSFVYFLQIFLETTNLGIFDIRSFQGISR